MPTCKAVAERFWPKVSKTPGCWLWTASTFSNGYGQFGLPRRDDGRRGKNGLAHRVAYELLVGPIPENLELDHTCENNRCVNPAHLEIVTHAENQLRTDGPAKRNMLKSHCIDGHPLTSENTRRTTAGARACRACDARRSREYRQRKAAA